MNRNYTVPPSCFDKDKDTFYCKMALFLSGVNMMLPIVFFIIFTIWMVIFYMKMK